MISMSRTGKDPLLLCDLNLIAPFLTRMAESRACSRAMVGTFPSIWSTWVLTFVWFQADSQAI